MGIEYRSKAMFNDAHVPLIHQSMLEIWKLNVERWKLISCQLPTFNVQLPTFKEKANH